MVKKIVYVVGAAAAALLLPGISAAGSLFKDVFIRNDAANPVPTAAQGTTQVAGSVDVRTGPEARTPYQHAILVNQTPEVCTNFVCTVTFPAVPDGTRLVITYASARYALTNDGTAPSVRVTAGNLANSVLLPAPVRIGFDSYLTAGPLTLYVEAGRSPTLQLGGQFVQPVSNTAEVAVVGYLVPT